MNKFQVEEYKQYTTTVRNAQMSQKSEFFIIIQSKNISNKTNIASNGLCIQQEYEQIKKDYKINQQEQSQKCSSATKKVRF